MLRTLIPLPTPSPTPKPVLGRPQRMPPRQHFREQTKIQFAGYGIVIIVRKKPRAVRVREAVGRELPASRNGDDAGRGDFVPTVEAAYVGVDVGAGHGDLRLATGGGDADVEADVDGKGEGEEGEEGEEGGKELHGGGLVGRKCTRGCVK